MTCLLAGGRSPTSKRSVSSSLPTHIYTVKLTFQDHLRSWLGDSQGRDQFLTFRDTDVNVNWNGRNGNIEPVKVDGKPLKNSKWGELYLQWSPRGTYLASLHPIGVNVLRFTHPGVRLIQFSPCENYLITWADEPLANYEDSPNPALRDTFGAEDEGNSYVVWDVKSTRVLRTFAADRPEHDQEPRNPQNVFKWSPDDSYIARCNVGTGISIYELPGMGLLDKKSIKIEGVQDFEWRPMSDKELENKSNGKAFENMMVYWQPEVANLPAKVNLMAVPSREIVRSKNLFSVTDVSLSHSVMQWQKQSG